MATEESKVQFNISNVHVAPMLTEPEAEAPTYGTIIPVPGSVSLTLDAAGSQNTFYADGIAYWVSNTNAGYTGSWTVARFPDDLLETLWGWIKTQKNVMVEAMGSKSQPFALLGQIDGDQYNGRFVFYKCTASRPGLQANTTTDATNPDTQSCNLTVSPLAHSHVIRARTRHDTDQQTYDGWFASVNTTAITDAVAAKAAKMGGAG